jgi:hypothetical protein
MWTPIATRLVQITFTKQPNILVRLGPQWIFLLHPKPGKNRYTS